VRGSRALPKTSWVAASETRVRKARGAKAFIPPFTIECCLRKQSPPRVKRQPGAPEMPCLRPVKNMHRSKLLGAEGLALCLTNPKRDNKSSCPSICCPSATKNFTARIQGSRIRLESGQPRDSLWLCFTYADASAGCSQANCRDIQLHLRDPRGRAVIPASPWSRSTRCDSVPRHRPPPSARPAEPGYACLLASSRLNCGS
jgi:hypothetical protein